MRTTETGSRAGGGVYLYGTEVFDGAKSAMLRRCVSTRPRKTCKVRADRNQSHLYAVKPSKLDSHSSKGPGKTVMAWQSWAYLLPHRIRRNSHPLNVSILSRKICSHCQMVSRAGAARKGGTTSVDNKSACESSVLAGGCVVDHAALGGGDHGDIQSCTKRECWCRNMASLGRCDCVVGTFLPNCCL